PAGQDAIFILVLYCRPPGQETYQDRAGQGERSRPVHVSDLYVSDTQKDEVRRYQLGEKNGTLVAGGNGEGDELNQLNGPAFLFVDRQQNVYVSDINNHRIMKWNKDATEDIVVAGGIFVDTLGTLYVADYDNHRVLRWTQGDKKQGTVIVGGNGPGAEANQFKNTVGLSFDRHGNLYVADMGNDRVQRFSIE
ncbi:unnamed protein product, partial [Rotaria socialis]